MTTSAPWLLAVLAGGPHTAARVAAAQREAEGRQPPRIVLSGREFAAAGPEAAALFAALCPQAVVSVDDAATTVASCLRLARLAAALGPACELLVVTSNYHAPRVRWLLAPLLPRGVRLRVLACPDLAWRDLFRLRLARQLILGEALSWLYGFPLGLIWRALRR